MRTQQMPDIEKAIELESEAISCGVYDATYSAVYSKQLASCFEQRYKVSQQVDDLNTAIKLTREAVGKSTLFLIISTMLCI